MRSKFASNSWPNMTGRPGYRTMEEVPRRTSLVPLAFPCFVLCVVGVETEGLLDYGRGIISIVRWKLRPVIFGVEQCAISVHSVEEIQGPPNGGGFKRGGFPDLVLFCPFLSCFVLFCPFLSFFVLSSGIFPICSGTVRGFSRFVLFLFLGLLRAPMRNSPERVRDTIWTFPEKGGKPPGLETPRFSFSQ